MKRTRRGGGRGRREEEEQTAATVVKEEEEEKEKKKEGREGRKKEGKKRLVHTFEGHKMINYRNACKCSYTQQRIIEETTHQWRKNISRQCEEALEQK